MPISDGSVDKARWRELNHAWWEERAPLHVDSLLYRDGGGGLEDFEWEELGAVDGLDVVHPQCHIGTDTIDLAGRGARTIGLDFSGKALEGARLLADRYDVAERCEWIESDLYDSVAAVGGRQFDLVFTGKGALCWLPDLDRWAAVINSLTRPGGRIYVSEFHPFPDVMSDDDTDIERAYFPGDGDIFDDEGSYAAPDASTTNNRAVDFIHPISEVVQSLLDVGFVLRMLHEHPMTAYPRWPWLETSGDGVWHMPADRPALPLMYSLLAERPA